MSEFNLKNKIAVITGGAGSMGFCIAEEFLKKDVKTIILLDNAETGIDSENKLNSRYGPNKSIFIKCDITKDVETIAQQIFDKFKKVDILVNCAGIPQSSVRKTMEINAIALMELSMNFYEHMTGNNDGTIINISSTYGFKIDQFVPIYKASKFAVVGFSRTLGHDTNYKKSGVRVIVVCPGLTRTKFGISGGHANTGVKQEGWVEFIANVITQDPEDVGRGTVIAYENAKSGSAWQIVGGKCNEIQFQVVNVTE